MVYVCMCVWIFRAHSTESFEIVEKVSDEDVTSLGSSGQLSASLRREKWLVQRSVDMMCDAGVVRMLVKVHPAVNCNLSFVHDNSLMVCTYVRIA